MCNESTADFWANGIALHQDKKQLSRIKSAHKLNVSTVNRESLCGVINDYIVTLDSCSCRDFIIRKKPCKHMYRLAHELNMFPLNGNVINDPNCKSSLIMRHDKESLKQTVSNLSLPAQSILQEIVSLANHYFFLENISYINELLRANLVVTRELTITDIFAPYTISEILTTFCVAQKPVKTTRRAPVISFFEENYPDEAAKLIGDAKSNTILLHLNPDLQSNEVLLQRFLAKKLGTIQAFIVPK